MVVIKGTSPLPRKGWYIMVKGNWEEFILDSIDKLMFDDRKSIEVIKTEIKHCYCFEFIEKKRYDELLLLLEERRIKVIQERALMHEQRMFEIRENQKRLLEQKERRELLIKADDEWRKNNVRRGRTPKIK